MSNCLWLEHLGLGDTNLVGGKCSSLGEMYNNLVGLGINVPNGFVLTVTGYKEFVVQNHLEARINQLLDQIDYQDEVSIRRGGLAIRTLILNAKFPDQMRDEVVENYRRLSQLYLDASGKPQEFTDVAVRSSSVAEDLAGNSFAGQYDTFLNVRGEFQLIESIKACYASLYNNRAISYRHDIGWGQVREDAGQVRQDGGQEDEGIEIKSEMGGGEIRGSGEMIGSGETNDRRLVRGTGSMLEDLSIAVVVQKMVRSDVGRSGVMFTCDPETGLDRVIVINASYGLCELVVQGSHIKPDEFIVNKERLKLGYDSVIDMRMGRKKKKMIYSDNPTEKVRIVNVSQVYQERFCLDRENVLELARWALLVEQHYRQFYQAGQSFDIEFAYDGIESKMYLVQVRPETVHTSGGGGELVQYSLVDQVEGKILTSGISVGQKISSGKVKLINSLEDRGDNLDVLFEDGDILVTSSTDPDWEPLMKRAGGIVTDCGGRTSHASIVSRELGVNCVVGCGNATSVLKTGMEVTVSCAEGDVGLVYQGLLDFCQTRIDLDLVKEKLVSVQETGVRLMMNLASPDIAFRYANLPHQGVGLVREEFIINNFIKVHPLALLEYDRWLDQQNEGGFRQSVLRQSLAEQDREEIAKLIQGYQTGVDYYISKLAFGLGRIATAVYPHPAIVRFSDFKSNEYANLLGGQLFEPNEENPMIGWRGCSRYYSSQFKEAFGLECLAIKRVREQMGLSNVIVMLPFCRTVAECQKVLRVMEEFGLKRGENGLQVYLMCELPVNVICADEFLELVDGYSIGSNDLTQTVLGIDRDSQMLSSLFDENNLAVRRMITMAIEKCRAKGKKIGICGQGPSDDIEFARFLVRQGINTISLTPDSILGTILRGF